jgi:hypothetical protein
MLTDIIQLHVFTRKAWTVRETMRGECESGLAREEPYYS